MNDWIILGLIWLVSTEILFFIALKIGDSFILGEGWITQKILSILWSSGFTFIQFLIVTGETLNKEIIIFNWSNLIWEFWIIVGLVVFFLFNYLIYKFIRGQDE